jgi:hypothetical protein
MPAHPATDTGSPASGSTGARRPARVLGYLAITLVWLVILAVIALLWAVMFLQINSGLGNGVGAGGVIGLVVVLIIAAPILGPALVLATGTAAACTALAGLAFVHAFNARQAGRPLTTTAWSADALGPVRITRVAISLLPTYPTRFGRLWARVLAFCFVPTARTILACVWIGAAYLVTVGWVKWPTHGGYTALWIVVSLLLLSQGVRALIHSHRQAPRQARASRGRRLP